MMRSKSFIRWAGGKAQIMAEIAANAPAGFSRYHEPFAGSAAAFFEFRSRGWIKGGARLSDLNWRLMCLFEEVRLRPKELIALIRAKMPDDFENEQNYLLRRRELNEIRALPDDPIQRQRVAALMLYLNRTCFNGLYRENLRGEMNSPYGHPARHKKSRPVVDEAAILAASCALNDGAEFHAADWRVSMGHVRQGDFVYVDSPYPRVKGDSFVAYSKGGFGEQEHRDLAAECRRLDSISALFMVSNADVPAIRELYAGFNIVQVQARRSINSNGAGRGKVPELLIRNYQIEDR